MRLKKGHTQRIEMFERRTRIVTARMTNAEGGVHADITVYNNADRQAIAQTLVICATALLEDYLQSEAQALSRMISDDIADKLLLEGPPFFEDDLEDLPF